ncbi:MAG: TRAP transporter substrate-binding protein [Chloroflexota bacterium]
MRKRGIQIALAVVLVAAALSPVFAACGGGGAPTGNETIKIRYAAVLPITPGYFGAPASESSSYYWEEAVETVTEGRIDIELYPSETLCKQEMAFDAVDSGIADIAWAVATYCRDWMPLETVFFLGLDMDSCEQTFRVHHRIYEEYLEPYYDDLDMMVITTLGREKLILFTTDRPIRTVEGFEGLSLMSGGIEMEKLISKLGALSVPVPYQDAYEAMQKGTMNAAMLDITAPMIFRWYDAGDPGYIIDCGGVGMADAVYIAHQGLLEKLRPEDAYALMKLTDYWLGMYASQNSDRSNLLYWEEVPKVGMETIVWSEDEKEKLRELKREVMDWWVGWMDQQHGLGDEAEEVLHAVLEEMENYHPGNITPSNPATFPEEWMRETLRDEGWIINEEAWQEVVGPEGHWGMDFVYDADYEPWYEEWWAEQNMEHPWYQDWKKQHQEGD